MESADILQEGDRKRALRHARSLRVPNAVEGMADLCVAFYLIGRSEGAGAWAPHRRRLGYYILMCALFREPARLEPDGEDFWIRVPPEPPSSGDQPVHVSGETLLGRVISRRHHKETLFFGIREPSRRRVTALADKLNVSGAKQIRVQDWVQLSGRMGLSKAGDSVFIVDDIQEIRRVPPEEAVQWRTRRNEIEIASTLFRGVRAILDSYGFLEVPLPTMTTAFTGGAARPFATHQHGDRSRRYLRVSAEIEMLTAHATGIPHTYSMAPSFRNGNLSGTTREYTLLEALSAGLSFAEIERAVFDILSLVLEPENLTVNRASMESLCLTKGFDDVGTPENLQRFFRSSVQPDLRGLWIVDGFPSTGSPLLKCDEYGVARRWLWYYNGANLAEVSENETSPNLLREALLRQALSEPQPVFRDYCEFLNAAAYGIPPTRGFGIGITKLVALAQHRGSVADRRPTLQPSSEE